MKKYCAFLFSIFILFISSFCAYGDDTSEYDSANIPIFSENTVSSGMSVPKIYSRAAAVMDTVSGRILYDKNAETERPMASTTKIMTAILALEKGNLSDTVTVSEKASRTTGSIIHLYKSERMSLEELLYGLLLNSGNDAAVAIAEHIGGSVENFAKMMTAKAKEIGALNTQFESPHGLDSAGHFTTASNLALIARYALRNKKFAEIVSTKQIITASGRHFYNTNEMLSAYPGANGVKTGYTGKAGRCLVTSATRNNWQLISVVLGSDSRFQRASDSAKILDYAFNNYKIVDLNKQLKVNYQIKVEKGKVSIINLVTDKELLCPLRKDEISTLGVKYNLPKVISAPLKKGTVIGNIIYTINNQEFRKINIIINEDINKKSVLDYWDQIIVDWLSNAHSHISDAIFK